MTDQPYNKREIDTLHESIHEGLGRIETQVKITNGRVSTIEKWQYTMMGGLGIVSIIIVPIAIWIIKGL